MPAPLRQSRVRVSAKGTNGALPVGERRAGQFRLVASLQVYPPGRLPSAPCQRFGAPELVPLPAPLPGVLTGVAGSEKSGAQALEARPPQIHPSMGLHWAAAAEVLQSTRAALHWAAGSPPSPDPMGTPTACAGDAQRAACLCATALPLAPRAMRALLGILDAAQCSERPFTVSRVTL